MISERVFSVAYTSLWREVIPSAESYVRHINLNLERYAPPVEARSPPHMNGVVNEVSYRILLSKWRGRRRGFGVVKVAEVRRIWSEVCVWLKVSKDERFSYNRDAHHDVIAIAKNLMVFLDRPGGDISMQPEFRGCGVVSDCFGDVLVGDVLVEVKAGGRGFRATDLRQIFTYCALARGAGDMAINSICLVNPRVGVGWSASLEDAALACGAISAVDLLDEIASGAVLLGVSN